MGGDARTGTSEHVFAWEGMTRDELIIHSWSPNDLQADPNAYRYSFNSTQEELPIRGSPWSLFNFCNLAVSPSYYNPTAPLPYNSHGDPLNVPSVATKEIRCNTDTNALTKLELAVTRQTRKDDPAYTDSGYESAKGPIRLYMHEENTGDAGRMKRSHTYTAIDQDGRDAHTSYAIATTILPDLARKCAIDICNNINSRLEGFVNRRALSSVTKRLPGLIEAFAVKIGADMPDQWSLRVMNFVHGHHQLIVSHLRNDFRHDQNELMTFPKTRDAMPLNDILSMWFKSDDKDPVAVDHAECFQGIKDEEDIEDEGESISILSEYYQTIVKSAAYEWLISSLIKEASLRWDKGPSQTIIERIRQEVLSQLPTDRFSLKRPPLRHRVSFKIPRSSLPFLLEDTAPSPTPNSPVLISDYTVTIATSFCSMQVSKVGQYMDQTWPLGGGALLSALQSIVNGTRRDRTSSNLEGSSKIEVILGSFYLEAFVTGTSYAVAEYGEQLAWLTAALQTADSNLTMYASPSLRRVDDCLATEELRCSWVIEVETERIDEVHMPAYSMQDWLGELKKPVIVRGFPTMVRPENCPGIEVAQQLLISLSPSPLPVWKGTRYLLSATGKVLQLFRQAKGVNVWHILNSPKEVCTCCPKFLKTHEKELVVSTDPIDLWQRRHIVTNCSTAEQYYRDTKPVPCPMSGIREVTDRAHSQSEESQLSSFSESVTGILCSSASVDVDMLSIPETSENSMVGYKDTNDAHGPTVEAVATRLLSEYKEHVKHLILSDEYFIDTKQCSPGQEQVANQGSSRSKLQVGEGQLSSIKSSGKRLAEQDGRDSDDDGEDDDQRLPKRKKPKHHGPGKDPQFFACPFWKHNPGKHRNCFAKKLNMISRVKQHLDRNHSPAYCDRCLAVFPDEAHKLTHLRDEISPCKFHQWAPLDGLTSEQRRKLSRKSNSRLTESQRWFVVWDIVFPGLCRPSSPYLDLELSQDLNHFREFSERRGPAVLIQVMREEGFMTPGDDEADLLAQRAADRAIRSLFNEWVNQRAGSSQNSCSRESSPPDALGEQQYQEQRRDRVHRLADLSSTADSGGNNFDSQPPVADLEAGWPEDLDIEFDIDVDDYLASLDDIDLGGS